MKLKIAHITDLSGMYFNIPDYQRGYRWETKQVTELLDDLLEFSHGRNEVTNGQFYCLQPLVVVMNSNIKVTKDDYKKVFDVIDGQQRLTTLFLIMNYLDIVAFHLRYERSKISGKEELSFDNGQLNYDSLLKLSIEEKTKNPDFFYLTQAIEDIKNWFNLKQQKYPRIKRLIEDVISSPDYTSTDLPFYELEDDQNENLKDVRFIWYDASFATSISKNLSIGIFKRLNYGKTALTAAELIKALLFQCDLYEMEQKPIMKQVAFRMSTEWDAMEKRLQDKFMWSMFMPVNIDYPSHIDMILSYVASMLEDEGVKINTITTDKDHDYLIFNKYLESLKDKNRQETVENLWKKIQDVFSVFKNWYEDRELYHLIGLYLTLKKTSKLNPELKILKTEYENRDRFSFIKWIKEEKIGKIIKVNLKNENDKVIGIDELDYRNHSSEIIKILLTYNVHKCMLHSQDRQRFPFYFYKDIIPSLEHIHPQHLHNEEIEFPQLCEWFKEKCEILKSEGKADIQDLKEAIDKLSPILNDATNLDNKAEYENNKVSYDPYLAAIDKHFDELADIDESELHCLSNMALVDKITNTILGNGLLNTKRKKLQDLSLKFDETGGKEGAITFVGTWKVFNKEFSTRYHDSLALSKSANLNFWSKVDRENYIDDIKEVYNEYVR